MIITQDEYNEIFKGFYINGVAVRDTGYIYITTREKRDDIDPVDLPLYFQTPVIT